MKFTMIAFLIFIFSSFLNFLVTYYVPAFYSESEFQPPRMEMLLKITMSISELQLLLLQHLKILLRDQKMEQINQTTVLEAC